MSLSFFLSLSRDEVNNSLPHVSTMMCLPSYGPKIMGPIHYGLKALKRTFSPYKLLSQAFVLIWKVGGLWWEPLSNSRVKTVVKHVIIKLQNAQRNDFALHIRLHLDELHCRGAVGIIPKMRLLSLQ